MSAESTRIASPGSDSSGHVLGLGLASESAGREDQGRGVIPLTGRTWGSDEWCSSDSGASGFGLDAAWFGGGFGGLDAAWVWWQLRWS